MCSTFNFFNQHTCSQLVRDRDFSGCSLHPLNRIGHCLPPKMGHTQVKTLLSSVKKGRWGQSCGGVSTSKCGRGTHGAFIQVPLGCSPARCAPTPGGRGKAGGSGLARVTEDVGGPAGELGMEPLTGMLRTGTTLPPHPAFSC